jgi:hypothetical protein
MIIGVWSVDKERENLGREGLKRERKASCKIFSVFACEYASGLVSH